MIQLAAFLLVLWAFFCSPIGPMLLWPAIILAVAAALVSRSGERSFQRKLAARRRR